MVLRLGKSHLFLDIWDLLRRRPGRRWIVTGVDKVILLSLVRRHLDLMGDGLDREDTVPRSGRPSHILFGCSITWGERPREGRQAVLVVEERPSSCTSVVDDAKDRFTAVEKRR